MDMLTKLANITKGVINCAAVAEIIVHGMLTHIFLVHTITINLAQHREKLLQIGVISKLVDRLEKHNDEDAARALGELARHGKYPLDFPGQFGVNKSMNIGLRDEIVKLKITPKLIEMMGLGDSIEIAQALIEVTKLEDGVVYYNFSVHILTLPGQRNLEQLLPT